MRFFSLPSLLCSVWSRTSSLLCPHPHLVPAAKPKPLRPPSVRQDFNYDADPDEELPLPPRPAAGTLAAEEGSVPALEVTAAPVRKFDSWFLVCCRCRCVAMSCPALLCLLTRVHCLVRSYDGQKSRGRYSCGSYDGPARSLAQSATKRLSRTARGRGTGSILLFESGNT
jgi:hypothetical protein